MLPEKFKSRITFNNIFLFIQNSVIFFYLIIGLLFLSTAGHNHHNHNHNHNHNRNHHNKYISNNISRNFISYETLTDGETEKLISYNGLTAKETSVRPQGDISS